MAFARLLTMLSRSTMVATPSQISGIPPLRVVTSGRPAAIASTIVSPKGSSHIEGTIRGILTDMVKCIRELTLNGNTVKIENLAIFKASVKANACSRYGVMRATIGAKTVRVNGQPIETGNAVKSMKLLAQATGEYTAAELNKDAMLGWTKKAQDAINADKAAMAQTSGGQG